MRSLLPWKVRYFVRKIHRRFVFKHAMRRFLRDPATCLRPESTVLPDLVYGWGNSAWSALDDYLRACVSHALAGRGPVLECGSGLSTILIGVIAKRQHREHLALEHNSVWAEKVEKHLKKYNLANVKLFVGALRDYGDFCWYDVAVESMPEQFSLVICDGPPGDTKGGRYGLVPVMHTRFAPDCTILFDDAHREKHFQAAIRWAQEFGLSYEIYGSGNLYAELTLGV